MPANGTSVRMRNSIQSEKRDKGHSDTAFHLANFDRVCWHLCVRRE